MECSDESSLYCKAHTCFLRSNVRVFQKKWRAAGKFKPGARALHTLSTHFCFIDRVLQWTMVMNKRIILLSVSSCLFSFWCSYALAYLNTGVTGAIEHITITPCKHRMSLLILSYHGPVITATTPMQLLLLRVKCVKVARSIITVQYRWPNRYQRRMLRTTPNP